MTALTGSLDLENTYMVSIAYDIHLSLTVQKIFRDRRLGVKKSRKVNY